LKNETPLPQWLAGAENYNPAGDKDAFIDKSILSVFSVLSRIRAQGAFHEPRVQAHAEYKLVFTLLLVVVLSVSHSFAFVLVVVVGLLCRLCLLPAGEIAKVLKSSLAAVLFTAIVLLPAGFMGNWYSITMITPKVFASVTAIAILSNGTRWHNITGALKFFFLPDLFIFVLDIAIKYILLLGEFALNMLYALKLRSVGRNSGKHTALSGVAGTMFLRSREMAEEMHSAMECRGFTGEYKRPAKLAFSGIDALVLAAAAVCVLLFIYLK
jgi:cobalt/nickel transport system permease protein